jgi:hypothetical protein
MSDATRAVALTEAGKLGLGTYPEVLQAATAYNGFLTADSTPAAAATTKAAATPAKAATTAKPATPAKAATTVKKAVTKATNPEDAAAAEGLEAAAAADAEADAEAETVDDGEIPESKEGVQAIIAKLLEANLRAEAIKLLKKFNAASATSVKEKDYGKFIAAGVALLPAESAEEDLTA